MIVIASPSGSGKSTMLARVLAGIDGVSGYATQRAVNGTDRAFFLIPRDRTIQLAAVPFLEVSAGRAHFKHDVYLQQAQQTVDLTSPLIVLDEIGGVELLSAETVAWLRMVKAQAKQLIVVFKGEADCARIAKNAGVDEAGLRRIQQAREALLCDVAVTLTPDDESALLAVLAGTRK